MRICTTFLLVAGSVVMGFAQSAEELELLRARSCQRSAPGERLTLADAHGGLARTLFVLYKVLVSSQDAQSCVFTPSCSEYALLSIRQLGLVPGVVSTFDRLTRCHGLSPQHYKFDADSRLLIDSVRNVRYERR